MGLHHQHNRDRVLRGLDARKHLEMTKRDSHGDKIKMHVPEGFVDKQETDDDGTDVVYNVVYVTASADFTGATAGYTTVDATPTTTPTAAATATTPNETTSTPTAAATTSNQAAKEDDVATDNAVSSATATSSSDSTSLPLATASSTSSAIPNKTLFLNPPASATAAATTAAAAIVAGTPLSATRTADSKVADVNHGMSGGAKAGLAFGIILGFALVAGLLFFCWRRRKNPNAPGDLNEKRASSIFGGKAPDADNRTSVAQSVRSTRTATTAPRLSLRPVTQFLPNLNENRKSAGNLLGIGGAASPMSEKPKSAWERRPVGSENPFEDNNEKQDRAGSPPPPNPFDEPEGAVANSKRSSAESNGSSKSSSESMTPKSNVGVAVGAPVAPQGPNNVHRVQLDFKPSMEDELELKSGQLVRMLHEYDDGWALCVRMDRSQQGVAPRTCLSKVPVKPRPQGPPNGQRGPAPGMRGPGPQQGPGMVPRALSPTTRETAGQTSPPTNNQSPAVARKPVPGQAL
nr:hypothetical protein CFP56_09500 [Quercus suber]